MYESHRITAVASTLDPEETVNEGKSFVMIKLTRNFDNS